MVTHVEGKQWIEDTLAPVSINIGGIMNNTSGHFFLMADAQEAIGVFDTDEPEIQVNHHYLSRTKRKVVNIPWNGKPIHFWEPVGLDELPRKRAIISIMRMPDPRASQE